MSNAISCFLVVFEQPCFHVFAEVGIGLAAEL